jgi:phosphate-selective porin OprO/OprP
MARGTVVLLAARVALAQTPALPPLPSDPSSAAVTPTSREVELEERVRQLESMVERLSSKVEQLTPPPPATAAATANSGAATPVANGDRVGTAPAAGPDALTGAAASGGDVGPTGSSADFVNIGGSAAASGPAGAQPSARFNMPGPVADYKAKVRFGPGFEIKTDDDEYNMQIHNLTMIDGRFYQQSGAPGSQVTDTFNVPRQWFVFSGRLTRPIEYYASLAQGFDNVNLLDAFLNVHFDDRLQFKIGRYKTPFTYEFYNLPVNSLINPERSLFFNNFGLNRDIGMMAWGQLFKKRVDYATGIFNGTRNGYVDANNEKDVAAFINFRPFLEQKESPLENWNIGGSVLAGTQQNAPIPRVLRTDVATTGNPVFGVPFMAFNSNIREYGQRTFWSLHSAYYYKHLSLLAEWDAGYQDYAFTTSNTKSNVPVQGYYVQAGYFVTGETVAARGVLKPLHDFDIRKGKFGLGALELTTRYQELNINPIVFQNGLVDPNLWTNHVQAVDLGFNWYWNQYVRMMFNWEHAMFGNPVFLKPGLNQLTSDEFVIRFQVFF